MHVSRFNRSLSNRTRTRLAGVALGLAVVVANSCAPTPTSPRNTSPSDGAVASTTEPAQAAFTTPKAETLPQSARPLEQGDYGVADGGQGSLKGTLASSGIR